MALRDWFRPPRHLIALFLLVTLLPAVLLMVFGWRLLQQDRELRRQEAERRREQSADLIVTTLAQALDGAEAALGRPDPASAVPSSEDSVLVTEWRGELRAYPEGRLLYYPQGPLGPRTPARIFERGEEIEYRENQPVRAAEWFRRLATASDAPTRAGALIRAARNLRKTGAVDTALSAYREAAALRGGYEGDVPADLLARAGMCDLLSVAGRTSELRAQAGDLRRMLLEAHWRITRPVFELHLAQTGEWGATGAPSSPRLALARAFERAWSISSSREGSAVGGRHMLVADGVRFTALARRDDERATVLVGGPLFVEQNWLSRIRPIEERDGVRVELLEPVSHDANPTGSRRLPAETRLPWTLLVSHDRNAAERAIDSRRTMWLGGLGVLAALVLGGTYVVGRAVSRELAVARLQADFVAAVSHEFRTPLTSVRQLSEMLIDRPDAPSERRRAYYEALQRQAERLNRLIEGLLDFGRMEAGTSPYRKQRHDADGLIRRIVADFNADTAARGHEVILEANSDAVLAVDADAFTNALWNLLDNAAKYSPAGSAIEVRASEGEGRLELSVTDHGFGIPADEQRQIFDKFVRGSRAKSDGISGTGVGLSMVRHIVLAHGGSIDVRSRVGGGSTFMIRLPVAGRLERGGGAAWRAS